MKRKAIFFDIMLVFAIILFGCSVADDIIDKKLSTSTFTSLGLVVLTWWSRKNQWNFLRKKK